MHPSIFRMYDIRGIVDETLTQEDIYEIGRVIGSLAIEKGEQRMAVGRDGRISGPVLFQKLCYGITDSGCDVIDVGVIPTPLLYYATFVLETTSGVMLTGSHNPPEYNGLKMIIGRETLSAAAIQNIYQRIVQKQYEEGEGDIRELEVVERYIAHVSRDIKLARPLKIVIDCANGVAGKVAPALFRQMGCEVQELFCEVDGTFPNHHPDPSQAENLQDLIRAVKASKADLGLAFDGDGDRLGVVDNNGEIIWPDRQMMLFAKSILARKPGAKIIYDVKCSNYLGKLIQELGGEAIMWKTGHSLIKSKLAETQAALAGEMSGHIFFKEGWYGFDDAIYAGARLLQIIAAQTQDCATLFSSIPNSINTPELKIFVSEEEKFSFMDKLIQQAKFSEAQEIITIDGLRVNFAEGWGLIRSSNTTPCLVLRFEAENETFLEKIKNIFREQLLLVNPDLVLPF